MHLNVGNLPENRLALTNKVYLSASTLQKLFPTKSNSKGLPPLVYVDSHAYAACAHKGISDNIIALNGLHRRYCQLALNASVEVKPFEAPKTLASIEFSVDLLAKKVTRGGAIDIDTDRLKNGVLLEYEGQVFETGRVFAMDFEGVRLEMNIKDCQLVDLGNGKSDNSNNKAIGQLLSPTVITFSKAKGTNLVSMSGESISGGGVANNLFLGDFDFEKLGIGGLTSEFNQIFRRAFASRVWPSHIMKQMGITHVRGMLLFGPPGCGKTLIARQIGKVLNAREPKIVNGPEILDKYVGASEGKIRELFADAEKEQKEAGESSMLHIIIMDEMDAICKARGSVKDGTGVTDSVVNQLLSKIDGVDSLNNILLIGMTNRKDMIDDALLRPGRLELHVEIGLPDEPGRIQILNIHTKSMRATNRLNQEVVDKLPLIAQRTKNFTGAEIEGLIKDAASFALTRCLDINDLTKPPDVKKLLLQYADIDRALSEIQPKFGAKNQELKALVRNGIVNYGDNFDSLVTTLQRLVAQVRSSSRTPLLSLLLHGQSSSGKTALAANLAMESTFPFIRVISADEMIGYSEHTKCQTIHRIFLDSYKSPLSLILLDDIERIIDYVPIGPRFSNTVLQTILVLLKKIPPDEGRRLMIIGTTSVPHLLEDLGIVQSFSVSQEVPLLSSKEEIVEVLQSIAKIDPTEAEEIAYAILPKSIGIKQLLMVAEMAKESSSDSAAVDATTFLECLHIAGF